MIATSQHTTLSIGQLHILEMMNRCRTEESLRQLKKLLFDFYSKEAVAEAARLWEAGVIDESKIEEWGRNTCALPTFKISFCDTIVSSNRPIWGISTAIPTCEMLDVGCRDHHSDVHDAPCGVQRPLSTLNFVVEIQCPLLYASSFGIETV